MTLYTTKAHIAYATLEAVAFQVREVLDAMEADSGIKLALLKVDGGMTLNQLLLPVGAPRGPLHVGRSTGFENSTRAAPRGVADFFYTDVRSILMVLC